MIDNFANYPSSMTNLCMLCNASTITLMAQLLKLFNVNLNLRQKNKRGSTNTGRGTRSKISIRHEHLTEGDLETPFDEIKDRDFNNEYL